MGDIIGAFKSLTTNACIRGVEQDGWPPFPVRLWQRNYYERVIRNDDEWARARRYIEENPLQWEIDAENPANIRWGRRLLRPVGWQPGGVRIFFEAVRLILSLGAGRMVAIGFERGGAPRGRVSIGCTYPFD